MHTSYFNYVNCVTAWKVKVANIARDVFIWCKIQEKKLLETIIPLGKCIQLKVYSHYVKNIWISSLTLFMIFWWIELAILRIRRKGYQNFIFNFEDIWKRTIVLYQTLIAFFHTSKLVWSRVLVKTPHSDGFYIYIFIYIYIKILIYDITQ